MEAHVYPEHIPRVAVVIWAIFIFSVVFTSLVVTALLTWAYCKIFSKVGYCWALGLLMLVPIANIIMPFILALGDWPIIKELRQLRQQQG